MKGKNKLVPRLLGITKECVMRVDEKTKEVIQEWNLTNIKRWAASPKSFTLVSSYTEQLDMMDLCSSFPCSMSGLTLVQLPHRPSTAPFSCVEAILHVIPVVT